MASEPVTLITWLGSLGVNLERIGLEAGPLSQWLYGALREAGLAVELLETRHVKTVLSTMPVKTDRNDARGIAQLMPHQPRRGNAAALSWFRPPPVSKSLTTDTIRPRPGCSLPLLKLHPRSGIGIFFRRCGRTGPPTSWRCRQIVDLSDMLTATARATSTAQIGEVLPPPNAAQAPLAVGAGSLVVGTAGRHGAADSLPRGLLSGRNRPIRTTMRASSPRRSAGPSDIATSHSRLRSTR